MMDMDKVIQKVKVILPYCEVYFLSNKEPSYIVRAGILNRETIMQIEKSARSKFLYVAAGTDRENNTELNAYFRRIKGGKST